MGPDQHEVTGRIGSADIAGLLRREISRGRLAPRDKLPAERTLADSYGVARGTVREALTQLAEEGLVQVRAGSGTYVNDALRDGADPTMAVMENARPLELMDARFALEPHICRLAVLHATARDLDLADEQIKIMEASTADPARFSAADHEFHTVLVESTGNSLLIWIMNQINQVRNHEQWSRMRHVTLDEVTINLYNSHHRQVLDAIRTREPELAAKLMKEHLEAARLSLTRAAAT